MPTQPTQCYIRVARPTLIINNYTVTTIERLAQFVSGHVERLHMSNDNGDCSTCGIMRYSVTSLYVMRYSVASLLMVTVHCALKPTTLSALTS